MTMSTWEEWEEWGDMTVKHTSSPQYAESCSDGLLWPAELHTHPY